VDETATVDVTITAVNDAPVGSNDHWIISQQTNAVLPTDAFLANDTDVENDPLSITALSLNGTTWLTDASDGTADGIIHLTTAFGALAVNTITGQVLYDVGGFTGDSTFYYRIDDGQGGIDDAQVTVTAVAVGSGSTADNIDLSAQTYDYSYINPANGGDTVTGGGNAVDIFTGGNGADHLFGSAGDDTINGGGDNDEINGGTGSDTIDGGSGDDTIVGSIGSDQLTGSSGNDTFQYLSILDGADTITDFDGNPSGGQDKIDLQGVLDDYGTSASVILDTNAGDGNDTLVYVNPTGGSSLVGATLMATVNNVTLDASDLQVLVGTTTTVV
jgi:Ca2+-binding RTX toxin-like protein